MEEWKTIADFPEYEISSYGSIRHHKKKILTPVFDGRYMIVCLKNRQKQSNKYIHRLIAIAFIPNPDNKRYVDHINRNKTDNRLENLRWVTASENGINQNYKQTNTGHHHITYQQSRGLFHVAFNKEKTCSQKNFKTLEEAIVWRDENLPTAAKAGFEN
jgi:hypothetical protein